MWKFIKSATNPENWLTGHEREVCFIGRSNVGKSSLINAVVGINKLAISSNTPGRTLLINFFQEDNKTIVDLPGYGYAKVSKKIIAEVSVMVNTYFEKRQELALVVLLIDARRGFTDLDLEMLHFISKMGLNHVVAVTKSDKINQSEQHKCLKNVKAVTENFIMVSAVKKTNINKLKSYIYDAYKD